MACFNPQTVWGVTTVGAAKGLAFDTPPAGEEWIGYWRLRDWLRLLNFELEVGRMGCYRPPLLTQRWLDSYAWMERVGAHWWPVLGAAYGTALDDLNTDSFRARTCQ